MKKKLLLGATLFAGLTFAQTAEAEKQTIPSSDSTKEYKGAFTFNGYLDVNYFHNLNNPQNGSNLGASGFERAFDQKAGQLQLGLVQTKISYVHKTTEAVVDLTFGPHADLGNYGNVLGPLTSSTPGSDSKTTTALAIKQAYFNWKATSKLTFTAGQFGTHIGYEVIDAPLNFHYSLNNLFNNGPFYHIGVKAAYAFTDKVTLMGGIVNNWDNLYDNNRYKSIISQLALSPNDNTKLYFNYIGGDENSELHFNKKDATHGFKQMLDFVGTFQLTDKFNLGVNAVIGQVGFDDTLLNVRDKRNWGGAALYLNYAFTKKFNLGARVDFLDNTQGVQYIGKTDVVSGTLTGVIKVDDEHLLIKPEIRFDNYKKFDYTGADAGNIQQFMDANGNYTKSSQITVGLALVYKF